jgi:hypothetical protein
MVEERSCGCRVCRGARHALQQPGLTHCLVCAPACPPRRVPRASSNPQYSTQGFHPDRWQDLTTTLDGPEVAIFKEACKKNKVGVGQWPGLLGLCQCTRRLP